MDRDEDRFAVMYALLGNSRAANNDGHYAEAHNSMQALADLVQDEIARQDRRAKFVADSRRLRAAELIAEGR